ncbi:MAG: methylmalonyl Co-A mutase-associated GTPase MeaB [Flavobacteriales bacterium]|nr:methylmalonyl Co-A mutase-associated GTPase MeaB [Flavobacteriales bacterium]|tara:strand:- start:331 stop:1287 length:957 start_codon:yes stop_codon:yes gene_type:complete
MTLNDYTIGLQKNNRSILSKAITLIESSLLKDKKKAAELIDTCLSIRKKSIRIGVSGTPGVGKSTFIEALGTELTKYNNKVAVLAIDPSSKISKGSILGDKTRMRKLGNNQSAFIRPSPSKGDLGGVCNTTKDTITLCEVAGYNIILIETVGVGQSETMVQEMTDFFIYLTLTQNGDEIQFIKKGVLELSDCIVINKSDENKDKANQLKTRLTAHLKMANSKKAQNVFICSALHNYNIKEIWEYIQNKYEEEYQSGKIEKSRNQQDIIWLERLIKNELLAILNNDSNVQNIIKTLKNDVSNNVRKTILEKITKIKVNF